LIRDGKHEGEMVKQVVSYRDDVFVWVYLDQIDRVIRYERVRRSGTTTGANRRRSTL